jgi:Kef-type K+ transport system membrane component KefB
MTLYAIQAPSGEVLEFFVLFAVILLGPIVFNRLGLPGLIGLVIGGFAIGAHGLGLIAAGNHTIPELGHLGLLYLMFVAGLELDLRVLKEYRRAAIGFGFIGFALPFLGGLAIGFALGWSFPATCLLGALLSSHTLIVYPTIREAGLSDNPAVASAVGATVLTDTIALVVLAVVAGTQTGSGSPQVIVAEIALGLVVLLVVGLLVLPRLVDLTLRRWGSDRVARYLVIVVALLLMAMIAQVFGIEGIVGAFFAGLALNRLVPNEGEFMERIEFYGSSLLIPMFLVSVGTVIDPHVLVDLGTIGIAAVFIVGCIGGKGVASLLTRRLFGYTWDEVGITFSLTVAQAAATLAATFVGLKIGLLNTSAVNAVMIVIIVSLVASSVSARRFGSRMPRPVADTRRLGRSVLVQVEDPKDTHATLQVACRLVDADGGVLRPMVVVSDGERAPDDHVVTDAARAIGRLGADADVETRFDRSVREGLLHGVQSYNSSFVVVPAATESWLPTLLGTAQHALVAESPVPVALVRAGTGSLHRVVLALSSSQARRPRSATRLAIEFVVRMRKSGLDVLIVTDGDPAADLFTPLSGVRSVDSVGAAWVESNGRESDLLVLPGGRNGALATARAAKQATTKGMTIAVLADARSVSAAEAAGNGLGLVTGRALPLNEILLREVPQT